MAFVHHTMLTAENLRGLPSKQLHTNVEPHYSPRSRAAPLCGVGGLVGVYSRPVIGGALFCPLSGFRYCYSLTVPPVIAENGPPDHSLNSVGGTASKDGYAACGACYGGPR